MSVNFDIVDGGGSFEPNYFHMLDQAFVFHTMDLSALNAPKKNKTFLVKELLTLDGIFNKVLFDFMNWIISENDREIFLSKTCHIKFIHTAANQDLLKIFLHSDSRCLLNFGHKLWVNKCFTGWKKKCMKDGKNAEVEKVDRMIKEIDEVFGQNPYDTDDSTITFESAPAARAPRVKAKVEPSVEKPSPEKPTMSKKMSKANMENEAPHAFDPEIDIIPQNYHPHNDENNGGYYGHQQSYSPYRGGPLPPRPNNDIDLYYAAELGRELVHRKSMSFTGGSSMFNATNDMEFRLRQDREFELIKSTKDLEIMNLKRELAFKQTTPYNGNRTQSFKYGDNYDNFDHGIPPKDSNDADDSTIDARDVEFNEQKRLEKALRDMMEYYDKALLAKDEQINSLQQELTTKGDQFAETMVTNMQALEDARKFYIKDLETTGKSTNDSEDRVQKELQFMKQSYEKLIASNEQKETELRAKLEEKSDKLEKAFNRIRKTLKDRTDTFTSEKTAMEKEITELKESVANNDADKASSLERLKEELDAKMAHCERTFNVERDLVELEKRRLEREMRETKELLTEKDLQIEKATEKHMADLEDRAKTVERYENLLSSKEADYCKMRRDMVMYNEKLANIESEHQKALDEVRSNCSTGYEDKRLMMDDEIRQLRDGQKTHNAHTTKKLQQELEKTVRAHETDLKFHAAAFNDERNRLKLRMQSLKESYETENNALRQQLAQKSEQLAQKNALTAASLEEARSAYLRELESKSASVDGEKYVIGKELSDLHEKYRILKEEMEVVMFFEQDRSDYIKELEDAVISLQEENSSLENDLGEMRMQYFQQKSIALGQISVQGGIVVPAAKQQPVAAAPVSASTPAPVAVAPVVKAAPAKICVDNFTQVSVPIMSSGTTQTEELKSPAKEKKVSAESKPQVYSMPPTDIPRQDSFSYMDNNNSIDHFQNNQETRRQTLEYMPAVSISAPSGDNSPIVSPVYPSSQSNTSFSFTQYVNMPRDSMLKSHSIAELDNDSQAENDFPLKVSLAPVKKSVTVKVPKAANPAAPSQLPPMPTQQQQQAPATLASKSGDKLQQRSADVQRAKLQFQQKLMATESLISGGVAAEKIIAAPAPVEVAAVVESGSQTTQLCERFGVQLGSIFDGELVKKKFSTEYIFEDNFVWINAAQSTIHWTKVDADKTNLKLSKFILLRRSPSFEKAKKDLGEMKGVVKSVEAVNGRLLLVADSGEKLELKLPNESIQQWAKVIDSLRLM